ncbi:MULTISPECIES: pyridoxamine 5'-phosphate oxidase family protein [Microbacterium]|uniref:Pyridoxamine 5'-phosphate oxidase n=1 Tax=Microbacterium wangchenii TaxID=2541726 RepID=A0ABX5SQU8_9MICO|nr:MULTISPECIES: pyridoxamine 5'-phosphate oxidase family protein [Microbacterium]MCK6065062.1 pyridoxamine 5'-phosphate oxidase family protein [Microbacterium sp. EYE_512]QBR88526.1 pyridoxamine 5'-phosphate oxidase [Microbacterium wangchenii]TFV82419.1 pyridoxamine 5'-phosphate oxidase [Microbacterium sp. dk485]TXK20253.1 pyridoxamine 5'-phosphate oxidase family protein [Microbacterium wangchenii]
MTADTSELTKLNELLKGFRFAMVTTRTAEGKLVAHPLTVQETEFDGDLWFVISRKASAVEHVRLDPTVGVSFSSNDSWLSLSGTAHVVEDDAKLREQWNAGLEAWFPEGPEDPDIVLLKVDADSAEYWDSPGGRVASLVAFVKHKVTGDRMEGENEKIDL